MQSVLSIAGSDPTGGAGLQADLQVFRTFGVHGAAVPTALTIQDGLHVRRVLPVFPSILLDQLRSTLDTIRPQAIKIGMLASDDSVRNVLLALAPYQDIRIVIDPVLASSDGTPLLEKRAYPALRDLMHRRCLITPNWPEAETLVNAPLPRRRDGEEAARQLLEDFEIEGVLLKGGHLEGDADDLLVSRVGGPGSEEIVSEWLPGERIPGPPVHGTGCALSAAIAAGLCKGQPLRESIDAARTYVRRAIKNSHTLKNGARIMAFE